MKRILMLFALTATVVTYSQKLRFNKSLNRFCETATREYFAIPAGRKEILDKLADEIAHKRNIIFTCRTNTRRTQFLQTWMQTAFYYYGIFNKMAFSYGDTVSEVYPEVISVLKKSGFAFSESTTKPKAYVFYISEQYQKHGIYPKTISGTIDTSNSVVVSICFAGEPVSSLSSDAMNLPYQSPTVFEKTPQEKSKYSDLNKQIAVEMLYLAEKARGIIMSDQGDYH
ncbi:MAG: hypothetical protein HYU69_17175 [Bacteroidetes bacterium]|nr:hypothetical protein [Bacteroidota bacterium]